MGIPAILLISGCVSDVYECSNVSDMVKTGFWKIRRIVKDATDEAFLCKLNITKWNNLTTVIIAYEYKDKWLVDDYSRTTRQFSEIFKKVFEFNSSIMIIGIENY